MPEQDRRFRPASEEAYRKELASRTKDGRVRTFSGNDPDLIEIRARLELTAGAGRHESKSVGRPVRLDQLHALLEFVLENDYEIGWTMVPEDKRRGAPIEKDRLTAQFPARPAWMTDEAGMVPQRVGTGSHIPTGSPHRAKARTNKEKDNKKPPLAKAAATHLDVTVARAGDLARQLADIIGATPRGIIRKKAIATAPEKK